ncbi:dipeptide ABC transporter ATP-binding protein [Corynebacterium halotolerans]|uniref:dipeptide ABC transporter ATP-binding protein n=1 Tax=Corynebacterium halotolerans TaxID=225326 RepID=UPI003CF5F392
MVLETRQLSIADLVHDVSFDIAAGERVGLIGESGSGKSLTALAIMGLLPTGLEPEGTITFLGQDLLRLRERTMRKLRGNRVAMVFQEPMTALDPLMRVEHQVTDMMTIHGTPRRRAKERARELFADVGLSAEKLRAFPHQLSGGQRQRVLIAMALANDPDLLICDEPTTALDVTVQRQVLDLILELVDKRGISLLFITHDLGVISQVCEKVVVIRNGHVLETGPTARVLASPQHAYTAELVAAYRPGESFPDSAPGEPVVTIRGLSRVYQKTRALDDVSLTVRRRERLGVVGGSGSGKTTLLRLIAGLDHPSSGTVEVTAGSQLVFQDPMSSLDPRMRVFSSVEETLLGTGMSAAQRAERVAQVLREVGLPEDAAHRYPHQFSGGQRQRISIARALAPKPEILLADEAVSALDATVRAQVLSLLDRLVEEYGLTLVFISHDLSVIRQVCSTAVVMHQGRIVEHGDIADVWDHPQHPYTRELLAAVPRIEGA